LSILTLVFGFALVGCGGDDDSGGEDDKPSSVRVFISTTDLSTYGEHPVATAASVSDKLYAVYVDDYGNEEGAVRYGQVQWYRDGVAIVDQTSSVLYDTRVAGSYTVTCTPENKPALTSDPVTVSDVTTDSVSISVNAVDPVLGADNITVKLTLSNGKWGTYNPHNMSLNYYNGDWGFSNDQQGDSTLVDAFKNAVTVTGGGTLTGPGVSASNTVAYLSYTPSTASGTVTATLNTAALASLVQYTSLASGGTLTAGTITDSDSEW
jgi:hypothetical protein